MSSTAADLTAQRQNHDLVVAESRGPASYAAQEVTGLVSSTLAAGEVRTQTCPMRHVQMDMKLERGLGGPRIEAEPVNRGDGRRSIQPSAPL